MTSTRTAWYAVAAYAMLLTYLLLAPHPLWFLGDAGQAIEKAVDRSLWGCVQHGLAYSVLGCLLFWASRTLSVPWQAAWLLLAVAHGITAEWLQSFIPHRFADWPDGLADSLGVGLGWLVALLILSATSKSLQESLA